MGVTENVFILSFSPNYIGETMKGKTLLLISLAAAAIFAAQANANVPPCVSRAAADLLPTASWLGGLLYEVAFVTTITGTLSILLLTGNIVNALGTFIGALIVIGVILGSVALLEYLKGK